MPKIRNDEIGVYVLSGGYVARPFKPTKITATSVKARHISGSIYHKVEDEVWLNSGTSQDGKLTVVERKAKWKYYLDMNTLV